MLLTAEDSVVFNQKLNVAEDFSGYYLEDEKTELKLILIKNPNVKNHDNTGYLLLDLIEKTVQNLCDTMRHIPL